MIVGGARFVPWLLDHVARQGSRELFTLAVLAIALGIAFVSSTVFGVSFALGAFLAGAVVGESDMSHQAAADALPLRDAFAVLFFVSVGMLLDPMFLVDLSARDPRHGRARRRLEGGREVRDRDALRVPDPDRPDRRRRPGPDRRVLVHPRHGRADPRAAADRGLPADRGGLAPLDRAQPVPVPGRRSARPPPARAPGPHPLARAAGRRPRRPRAHRGRDPAPGSRDPVRVRPGRPPDRPGPRPARVPVRRPDPAAA